MNSVQFEKIDANTTFGFWARRKIDASPSKLLERMDRSGVKKALTCSLMGFLYDFKQGNLTTKKICSEYSNRLIPVGTINPQRYFGCEEEIDRIIADCFKIVRFFPTEQEWNIGQRHFTKLLEKLSQTDLTIMIPSTEGITAIGDVFGGIKNNVIIETVRVYPHLAELIVTMQENPNLYAETHLVGSMDFIEVLTGEVGADRLVFGSGAPIYCFSSATLAIANSAISDDSKKAVFSGNISRILKL